MRGYSSMKHTASLALFREACEVMPGGVNSPVRSFSSAHADCLFAKHAYGSHVVDVDDNTYLDYIGSWGPMILGHAHPLLCEHLEEVIQKGISFGLCTPQEVELAKLMIDAYPGLAMVRMVNSGTEATMSAIRAARGFTGRDKIIKFEGCYHGHSDGLLVKSGSGALTFGTPTSPGVPADVVKHTLVCSYNDLAGVKRVIEANEGEIAAIILEPIAGNMGVVKAEPAFLQGLRTLCDAHGIVLIFDEVISGFRIRYGGAAEFYGIVPDMACFGKIIGAGLPVGAYGGRADIMKSISPSGPVYQAGTLSGNPLAMHLGCRLLRYLKEHPKIYTELEEKGAYLKAGLQAILNQLRLPYQIHQVGSLLTLFFTEREIRSFADVQTCDVNLFERYFRYLYDHGILIAPSPYEAMFLSAAHTYEELDETLLMMQRALEQLL